jgi:tetratricopeptide (TPR) repeat protein
VTDPTLFAGRAEELKTIKDEIARLASDTPIASIVALIGERRVGKTSVLLRVAEKCQELLIFPVAISIDNLVAKDPWEFWHEIFSRLLINARDTGISVPHDAEEHFGFKPSVEEHSEFRQKVILRDLWFPNAYSLHISNRLQRLGSYIVENDLNVFLDALLKVGQKGLLLILDEAHLLVDAQDTKQQMRHCVQHAGRCGIVFAGQSPLGRMFTDTAEPFFGQAKVVPLGNFTVRDDIAECALLPLSDDERKLMSPMTIEYLARSSQGKPNQIRLICSGIYERYKNGSQNDLEITVDVLDDVMDSIAKMQDDPDLRHRVQTIQRLNSVDLEILHNMTRYPNWSEQDIIDLDESFRGGSRGELAIARRTRMLKEKRRYFVGLAIMADVPDKYVLAGGEFADLYLRLLHEVLNQGRLSKKLILGKPPATPFGEKAEKLVRAFSYAFGEYPELRRFIFHSYHRDYGDIIEKIKRRFSVFADLMDGKKLADKDLPEILSECFSVCQLTGKPGEFYLVCLSVRNSDKPREIIQVELYFDINQDRVIDLASVFRLLTEQAAAARVLIEGYDAFWVKLPDLSGLLNAIGGATIDEVTTKLPLVLGWQLASIQHHVRMLEEELCRSRNEKKDEEESSKWITLYGKGEEQAAEEYVNKKLGETDDRQMRAMLLNDRGYMRCGAKLKEFDLARRDLETAIDLHYSALTVSLSNLSILDIDGEDYDTAISRIEQALFLTLSSEDIEAAYLRLRLPENHLGFKVKWEQHPANVIEASYINLAYAFLKSKGYQEAYDVLQEGLALMPSSTRLKHGLARLLVFTKRVNLAIPIYRELSEMPSQIDEGMAVEIRMLGPRAIAGGTKKTRKQR